VEKIPIIRDSWNQTEKPWENWLAHDYGSSAPSATYIMVRSPGEEINGQYFPKDSIIIVDELVTS
jgi:hypothetical protein